MRGVPELAVLVVAVVVVVVVVVVEVVVVVAVVVVAVIAEADRSSSSTCTSNTASTTTITRGFIITRLLPRLPTPLWIRIVAVVEEKFSSLALQCFISLGVWVEGRRLQSRIGYTLVRNTYMMFICFYMFIYSRLALLSYLMYL